MKVTRLSLLCPVLITTMLCHIEATSQPPVSPLNDVGCGGSRQLLNPKIIGGKKVCSIYPSYASIRKMGEYVCGGTLITNYHVVTAASCFNYTGFEFEVCDFSVVLGDYQLSTKDKDEQVRGISKWKSRVKDVDGSKVPIANDLGLIKLDSPVTFNKYVRAACLATPRDLALKVGQTVTVIGHGKDAYSYFKESSNLDKTRPSNYLKQADVTVRGNQYCFNKYMPKYNGSYVRGGWPFGDDLICVVRGTGLPYILDTGSPVMIRNSREVVVGIVVYGIGRDGERALSKISYHYDWIDEQVKDQGWQ